MFCEPTVSQGASGQPETKATATDWTKLRSLWRMWKPHASIAKHMINEVCKFNTELRHRLTLTSQKVRFGHASRAAPSGHLRGFCIRTLTVNRTHRRRYMEQRSTSPATNRVAIVSTSSKLDLKQGPSGPKIKIASKRDDRQLGRTLHQHAHAVAKQTNAGYTSKATKSTSCKT